MANLWSRLRGGTRDIQTLDDYATMLGGVFGFGGLQYPYTLGAPPAGVQQTLAGSRVEHVPPTLVGFSEAGFKASGVIFACMMNRQLTFSAVRFQFQRINAGRPSELFGNSDLALLEQPWPGGTTQDLLSRMIQDADLAGNSYWVRRKDAQGTVRLQRLRPDWVEHLLAPVRVTKGVVSGPYDSDGGPGAIGWEIVGYMYTHGGANAGENPVVFAPDEVCHFAPIPDPEAPFRGMSWMTPIIRELQADQMMTRHKLKFFENGATPNMVVKHPEQATPEQVRAYRDALAAGHAGVDNAYKTLHVGGGADVTLVGANMQQIEFAAVQGHGETRIAAAAGIPPIIVGLSEGLASATYSNYAQARRRYADGTLHPLWANAAGSLQQIVPPRATGQRLWYDCRDVPFLREDEKDAAQIQLTQAQTMAALIQSGYTADTVQRAVLSGDYALLKHSGLFSVQLQPPGSVLQNADQAAANEPADDSEGAA